MLEYSDKITNVKVLTNLSSNLTIFFTASQKLTTNKKIKQPYF